MQFIKNFYKIIIPFTLILKTTKLAFLTNIMGFNDIVYSDNKGATSISNSSIGMKVKNLLKVNNIEKLAKFKKSDFTKTKTNRDSETHFLFLKLG